MENMNDPYVEVYSNNGMMVQLSNNEYKINNRKTRVSVYNFQLLRKPERKLCEKFARAFLSRSPRMVFRKLSISLCGLDSIFQAVNVNTLGL